MFDTPIKVLAGDFRECYVGRKGLRLRKKGLFAGCVKVPFTNIVHLEQLTQENAKSFAGTLGRAAVGGLLLGP